MRNPFTAQPQFWRTWLAVSLHIFLNLVIGLVLLAGLLTFLAKVLLPPPPVWEPCPEVQPRQLPAAGCFPLDWDPLPPPAPVPSPARSTPVQESLKQPGSASTAAITAGLYSA